MEIQILNWLQSLHTPILDKIMQLITHLGDAGIIWIILTIVMILIPKTRKSGVIMAAAMLSFIGLGVQPPTPEWGAMIAGGRSLIRSCPWMVTFPGLFIMLTVLALNIFGDGLRDALDPKLKK